MAARFCKRCQVNYPITFLACRVCGSKTEHFTWRKPDEEWAGADPPADEEAPTEPQLVFLWRATCLRELGVEWEESFDLASRTDPYGQLTVDLGEFRALIKKGWSPEQAAAVLA